MSAGFANVEIPGVADAQAARGLFAAALGLTATNAVELVQAVRDGFDGAAALRLVEHTGLTQAQVATLTGVPERTLRRRAKGARLTPSQSDGVLRAARIFDRVVALFEGEPAAARRWLETPARALGGECPLAFASTGVGAREVEALIGRLEHGVFS